MESITIKQTKIFLNFETQISLKGRPFRLSGTRKNLQLPSRWVEIQNKGKKSTWLEKWHWIYEFKYLDEQGGFFAFEYDYNDKLVGKL